MKYYFEKEDFDLLKKTLTEIRLKVKKIGKEMGSSCEEGAETFHDNFAYEEGERQQQWLTKRFTELEEIARKSEIITKERGTDSVSIGNTVKFEDLDSEEEKEIRISSYMVFRDNQNGRIISYNSPLARMLLGAQEGDVVKDKIAGKTKKVQILEIS